MKKIISFIFPLAVLFSACIQEELQDNQALSADGRIFTAAFDHEESRTYIEDGNLLRWNAGDQISIFEGNTLNRQYQFDGETGDNSGTFSIVNKPFGTGNDLDRHYAVYPYASGTRISENGVITVDLPASQNYAAESFGLGANTMVAVTKDIDDTFLKFRNVCGYLKLQLYGDDVTVKSITLKGNNNEKIAGKASVTYTFGEEPTTTMTDDATTSVTLDCGEGVTIGTTPETLTDFWIILPPTTFNSGFEVTITDLNGGIFTKSTSNKVEIERNLIKPMATCEVQPKTPTPYLTFSAEQQQSLTMTKAVATLEYSVNGDEWKSLGTKTITFGGELGPLCLRGKNTQGTAYSSNTGEYATVVFGNDVKVSCSGDIRTLLDYENYNTVLTSYARFCWLFNDCKCLIQAPKLPATTLATSCYNNLFRGCTSLSQAPDLPATIMADFCYNNMFYGCTDLKQAPLLPSTNLANACYGGMFLGCTSLTQAPELPATILTENCYYQMFLDCTSLTQAPKLPATSLAKFCYGGMFGRCTSLTQAPELPATTLAEYCYIEMLCFCTNLTQAPDLPALILTEGCYQAMFYDCNKIDTIVMLATNISATNCLDRWLSGVASNGTLFKAAEMTSLSRGDSGIPNGWEVKDHTQYYH